MTYKVGDKFRVVRNGCPAGAFSTNLQRYKNMPPDDRVEIGEILEVVHLLRDKGPPCYKNALGNYNVIPLDFVELIQSHTEPKPAYKVGDKFRVTDVSNLPHKCYTTDKFRWLSNSWPKDGLQIGEVIRAYRVVDNVPYYKSASDFSNPREIPLHCVTLIPESERFHFRPFPFLVGGATVLPLIGVLFMPTLLESIATDPVVHASIVSLILGLTTFALGSLAWLSVRTIAKGVARVEDRNRKLKAEDDAQQKDVILAALKNTKN
jgi:hypothetical protein